MDPPGQPSLVMGFALRAASLVSHVLSANGSEIAIGVLLLIDLSLMANCC